MLSTCMHTSTCTYAPTGHCTLEATCILIFRGRDKDRKVDKREIIMMEKVKE